MNQNDEPKTERVCEWCGGPILFPHEDKQRFCCREHSDAYYQAERRAAVKFFRASGQSVRREDDQQVAVGQ